MNKFSSDLTIGEMLDVGHEISTKSEEDFDGRKQELEVWTGDASHEQMVCRQGVLTLPKHC